jgi:hypothetical protein
MITLFALASLGLADPDLFAPAKAGQAMCVNPDLEAKTCQGMATYTWNADGSVTSRNVVAVSPEPLVVLHTQTAVVLTDTTECSNGGTFADQITRIEIDGEEVDEATRGELADMIGAQMDAAVGTGELCFAYVPQSDGSLAFTGSTEGRERTELAGTARWISESDGWRVAP